MDSVLNCLVSDAIGPGEVAEKFAKAARETMGYEYAIALRSPCTAVEYALDCLGLKPGSRVAISALAPVFHRIAVEGRGFETVYYDHDVETCMPDFAAFESMNPRPSALVLFDVFGLLPSIEAIKTLGIPVIEDMSQALGAAREGCGAGSLGTLSVYGLEQGGVITSGGGALLFATLRRDAQVLKNIEERIPRELLMTDLNAALGVAQLRELESTLETRRSQEERFRQALSRTRHGTFAQQGEGRTGTYVFPVSIESGMRDARVYAKRNGVETEPSFEGSVVNMQDFPGGECPGAKALALRCLSFPVHQRIGGAQATAIGRVLATLP